MGVKVNYTGRLPANVFLIAFYITSPILSDSEAFGSWPLAEELDFVMSKEAECAGKGPAAHAVFKSYTLDTSMAVFFRHITSDLNTLGEGTGQHVRPLWPK